MSKIILHIDLNQFFVRCEEIKNPSLIGKPVAVGGDGRRGIVSTCSYKAREYGIHSGMPMFQAKMLCKDLIITGVDFEYYELMSKEFIDYVKKYTYKIEQMSIDECFCDITEAYNKIGNGDILKFLKGFQIGLYKKTQLNCSIGVAPTKFLAKMGSDIKKPNGITIIRKRDIEKIIFPLPVKDFFGIGKKTAPRLEKIGFSTIGELYYGLKNDDIRLKDYFESGKDTIISQLEGNSSNEIYSSYGDPKSIGQTRTLNYDTNDAAVIKKFLENMIDNVINDFLKLNMLCKTIQITYKDADCSKDFKTKTCSKSFSDYTNDKKQIRNAGLDLFSETYDHTTIRLIGFTIKSLKAKHDVAVQMTFENFEQHEKENKTQMIINDLNRKAKKKIFFRLSDLTDKHYDEN